MNRRCCDFRWLVCLLLPAACTSLGLSSMASEHGDADPLKPPAISTQNVPAIPPGLAERLRQYENIRSAEFRGWAPAEDPRGGMLIETRFGDTAQLHRVYEPGGRREQATFFDEPAGGRFIPKAADGSLLVTMSAGGNEQYQISRRDGGSGKAVLLTDGQSRNLLGPVSDDGSRFIFSSNRRNGRDTDLYVADTRLPGLSKLVFETDGEYWEPADLSRDAGKLLINHYVSINESYPAVLDIASGEKQSIAIGGPRGGTVTAAYDALRFGSDTGTIYFATDAWDEFRQLWRRAEMPNRQIVATRLWRDIAWDVADVEVSHAGNLVAFTVNEDGASSLYWFEDQQRNIDGRVGHVVSPLMRIELPLGVVGALEFSPDDRRLGFTLSRADAPAEAWSYDFQSRELTRWTWSETGGLDHTAFIAPERIQFPTFDTAVVADATTGQAVERPRMVPAYYFRPRSASPENPVPVLINIHGGPEGQYRPTLSGFDQFLLSEIGVAVIRPNVRGSAGYGKSYLKLDNAEKREDSVRDIGALLDWIAGQPELDAGRVAVIGGSYGGYMVLGSLVHYSDRLRAGVDIVGIASFKTFLENTSPYRQDLRRAEYGDERDPRMQQVFARIDPLNNTEKITAALFVAHGRNDPRVPFSEAEQIAEKVRAQGRPVWTVYADNEGHGFGKKHNRDYLYAAIALFLREQLLHDPGSTTNPSR